MQNILHTGHLGIERIKSNVRSTMYWPSSEKGIGEMISICNACQKYRNLNPLEPLLSHEIPKDIWKKVAADMFICLNKLHLIVIDYSSYEFKKFSKSWDFIHKTSSPKFPQSSGFVERTIQTIKETLRK